MAIGIQGLTYDYLEIENKKTKRKLDISNSVICTDYYEDLLQPYLLITLKIATTRSIVSQLPIRTGLHEMVALKYSTPSGAFKRGDLDGNGSVVPDTGEMYVYKVSGLDTERQASFFTLHLVSKECIVDRVKRVRGCFKENSISKHVEHILKNILKTKKTCHIDRVPTTYKFWANNRPPFSTIQWLGPKCMTSSVSGSEGEEGTLKGLGRGIGGCLLFERQDGFHFKSLDTLASRTQRSNDSADLKEVKAATYSWTGLGGIESASTQNNFRILNHIMEKNQDLRKALTFGMYASRTEVFNPQTLRVSIYEYNLKDEIKNQPQLGEESMIDVPVEDPSRVIVKTTSHGFAGIGSFGLGDSGRDRTDEAKASARYNLLLSTQSLRIEVPCNTRLQVGDIIDCEFPELKDGKPDEVDKQQSGKWLIAELCHHFQINRNITAMRLIRDSYGYTGSQSPTEKLIERDYQLYGDTFPEGSFNITK